MNIGRFTAAAASPESRGAARCARSSHAVENFDKIQSELAVAWVRVVCGVVKLTLVVSTSRYLLA